MTVWQSNEQEVWLDPPDEASGTASVSRVGCLKGRSIWLAFLESPNIWQAGAGGAGESPWKPPFPAKWRWSYVRANGLADSWDQEKGPGPGQNSGQHEGPLLMYPLDRSSATPLTALCPTDVMRNTLGVGPCQYILACEGLGAQGDPTPNSVMNWVEKQFELKKEKKVADDIKERLRVMTRHVADARQRIKRYGEFSMKVRSQVGSGAGELGSILEDLDRFVAAGLAPAASPERAGQLADKVAALIGQPDAMAACRSLGEQLREIGAVQDGALARSRMAVRRLKAQCRSTAVPQEAGGSIKAIEQIAETMLRNK
jgi:hypothetical protein